MNEENKNLNNSVITNNHPIENTNHLENTPNSNSQANKLDNIFSTNNQTNENTNLNHNLSPNNETREKVNLNNNLNPALPNQAKEKRKFYLSVIAFILFIVGIFITNLIARNVDEEYIIPIIIGATIIVDIINAIPIFFYLKDKQPKESKRKIFYFLNWFPLFLSITYALAFTYLASLELLYYALPLIIIAVALKPKKEKPGEEAILDPKQQKSLNLSMNAFWIFSTCAIYSIWFMSFIAVHEWIYDLLEGGSSGVGIAVMLLGIIFPLPLLISLILSIIAIIKYKKEIATKRRKRYHILNWITVITLLGFPILIFLLNLIGTIIDLIPWFF